MEVNLLLITLYIYLIKKFTNILTFLYDYFVFECAEYQSMYFLNYNLSHYDLIIHSNINSSNFLISLSAALGLVFLLLLQARLLNLSFYPNTTFDSEKYSPYECGFNPFRTERSQFDIKFYLIALLFLVFDVELMFLLPFCLNFYYLNKIAEIIFVLFFVLLLLGFLVEWAIGMLVWKGSLDTKNLENKNKINYSFSNVGKNLNYIDLNSWFLVLNNSFKNFFYFFVKNKSF